MPIAPKRASGSLVGPSLVGRDDVLSELEAAASAAGQGSGCVVLLSGDAGIGKTSVLRALGSRVSDELTITWGRSAPDGAAPAFWPWYDVVDPVGRTSEREPHDIAGARRFEQLTGLRDRIVARAHSGAMLHLVEDVQWADVASVLLLAEVAAVAHRSPVMVVATLRTGEPISDALADALEVVRRFARTATLPALGAADVAVLMRGAGIVADPDTLAIVLGRTGGNPLLVTELVRAGSLDRAGDVRASLAQSVPDRVAELVSDRLKRLPDTVAEAVRMAAVMGVDGTVRALASSLDADPAATIDLLEQARAMRLFEAAPAGRWRFRHDLVRDAVYTSIAASGRAIRHARALEALSLKGAAPPAVLAHHALAAQPLLDADRAVALAARAGQAAYDMHAYEEAVEWFGRALATAPTDTAERWRAELLVLCGEAHRQIGQIEQARRAFLEVGRLTGDPTLLMRAALGYADPGVDLGIAYRTTDPAGPRLLEQAIAAQPVPDAVPTVLLEARLAAVRYFSDDLSGGRVLARSAVARAERLGDPAALVAAGSVTHDAFVVGQAALEARLAGSARLVEWAQQAASPAALLTAHRARVFDLLAAGDLVGVDEAVLAFRRVADPLHRPSFDWWPAVWSAMRALLAGRHAEAEQLATAAFEIGRRAFPETAFTNLSFLLFFLRREQGRLAEMEQLTRDFVASHADIPALWVGLTLLLAELDQLDEARAMLASFDRQRLQRVRDRNWPASWFQLARAAFLVEDRSLASILLGDGWRPDERCVTVSLATVCLGASDLGAAWLWHTLAEHDTADECYEAAAEFDLRIGARAWLAQTHVDHARLLADRGRSGDLHRCEELLRRAEATATELGVAPVLGAARHLRVRLEGEASHALSAAHSASGRSATVGTFRLAGPVWELGFAGRTVHLPDARGLRDLACLLARPGEAVSAIELLDGPHGAGGGGIGGRGAEVFDVRARRQIHARLRELDAEVDEAESVGDLGRAALAREQLQLLAESVARDLGLGGRSRRLGDPVERARKTVSTRIRRAIALVGRSHPELGRHLERSIDTGGWCAYRPAEQLTWRT